MATAAFHTNAGSFAPSGFGGGYYHQQKPMPFPSQQMPYSYTPSATMYAPQLPAPQTQFYPSQNPYLGARANFSNSVQQKYRAAPQVYRQPQQPAYHYNSSQKSSQYVPQKQSSAPRKSLLMESSNLKEHDPLDKQALECWRIYQNEMYSSQRE